MGLLKKIRKYRCASFTLMEAIIAIVIIMVCFGLSTMIYINIIRSDARLERSKAFMETKRSAIQTNMDKRYFDEEMMIDSLRIKRTIEAYQNDPELKILIIEAFNGKGKKMSSYKQIVISK
jgi:Tfp pilus assembly protein PilE